MVDAGQGVGPLKNGVYLDFSAAIERLGKDTIEERYGNLFEMYERITGESPYVVPMRIYPASHYTMGGLWVDYELQTTIPGLFCAGEANFSDHGANRLGASALMQGLSDGYFVLPYTIAPYLADLLNKPIPDTSHEEFAKIEQEARDRFAGYMAIGGTKGPDHFHRELGKIIWDYCGMDRTATRPREGAVGEISALHAEFKKDLKVTGSDKNVNQTLEKAGRVDDFFELGMLMCRDALNREESCGGHFRSEHQTDEGEALRNDDDFAYVSAWEWTGDPLESDREQRATRVRSRPVPDPELQVTSHHQPHTEDLAPGRPRRPGSIRVAPDPRDLRGGVAARTARHPQRTPHRGGQGSRRVRSRLSRGHLRNLLTDDRRQGARTAAGHRHLSGPHAGVLERRRNRPRAVASCRIPGHQGPDGRPGGVRPHHRSRRLHHRRRPAVRPMPT